MEVNGSKIPLPEGFVIGAAFYESGGMFFVQQNVLSAPGNGLVFHSRRRISSWSLASKSIVSKRDFEEGPPGASSPPCGRVEVSAKVRRVFICSSNSYIEVLDPSSLIVVRKMAQDDAQRINDFAVDDLHNRLIVLARRRGGSVYLTSYSLVDGGKEQEAVLSAPNFGRMILALASRADQVGIAIDSGGRGEKAQVYTCSIESSLTCSSVTRVDSVSQISFLGRQVLVAASTFADNKKECLLTVDPATRSVKREYCSPSTGVHYAVGVVDKKYVVAFTGVSKRIWFSEENKTVSNTFSVWREENFQVAAVAKDSTDYGAFQNELEIVASGTEMFFVAYQRVSNRLTLYSIVDTN